MNTHMPTQRNGIGNTMARRYTAGALAAVGLIVFTPPPTHAQVAAPEAARRDADSPRFEVRPFVGAYLPTGDQRDLLSDVVVVGGQVGYAVTRNVSVLGSFGWAAPKDALGSVAGGAGRSGRGETVDLFQYDVGVEGRVPGLLGGMTWAVSPFAGVGAGGRTYRYRDLDGSDAQTNVAGYGALGLDVAPTAGRLGLRVEARNYVSGFKGLRGEFADRRTRNDLTLTAGLAVRF
jgi:hypothetical protein